MSSTPRFLATLTLLWSLVAAGVLALILLDGPSVLFGKPSEDPLVYAAVLDSLTAGWGPPGGHPGESHQIVVTASIEDETRSEPRVELPRDIPTRKPSLVVTRQTVAKEPEPGGADDYWEYFERRFPNSFGWFDLSPVRYSLGGRVAELRYGHYCGWLCGSGGVVQLKRTKAGWRVSNVSVGWVS